MGLPQGRILWRHRAGPRYLSEKRLHMTGRKKGDQHPPSTGAHMCPDVRYLPGCKERISRQEVEFLRSDLQDKFAFKGIEPFVLFIVQVPGWTASCVEGVFDYK